MHPVFKFCTKDKALEMAEKFVEEVIIAQLQLDCEEQGGLQERKSNIYNKILIGLDNFGKEEVLVRLAEKFDTYIVVD